MKNLIKIFTKPSALSSEATKLLYGKNDLLSLKDAVHSHIAGLQEGGNNKSYFTSDPKTIGIAQKVFAAQGKPNTKIKNFTVDQLEESNFFENNIFHQPTSSSSEAGSIKVLISDINDFPKYKQQYEASKHKNSMLCVGGPAAEDQIVMASIIDQVRARLDDIIYITRDYNESNVNHSAKQSHARHGNALNADEALSGHRLLPILLMRKLLGVTLDDVLESDYKKIDVEFTIDPKKLRIYFGNELNWLKQELKKRNKELTEHDVNRLESVLSQEILMAIEAQTGAVISGGLEKAKKDSSSIHVNFNSEDEKHLMAEIEDLTKVGIESKKLSPTKHEFFFGKNDHVHSAYEYLGIIT